jgi:4,5-DOPA dioxygenase extradiol
MDTPLPSIFVSHGSPMIALEPGAGGAFLQDLGPVLTQTFGKPRAIVAISAHTMERAPLLLAAARHEAVYDFGNFDPRLFTLRYDVAGAPALAERVATLLAHAGIAAHTSPEGGLDHGNWTALRYLFPDADIPVLPLADEGVLVLGSGSITHNLRRVFAHGMHDPGQLPEIPESRAFRDWMLARSTALDWETLFAYRSRAPHAVDMHPSDEHLLPWYVAAGAGGRALAPQRLHDSVSFGSLGMDAYAFGATAPRLHAALATFAAA